MIEINNSTQEKISKKLLEKVGNVVLKGEGKGDANVSVAIVSGEEMRKLNKTYRKKDQATDVLSFSGAGYLEGSESSNKEEGLGEIIICPSEIRENAQSDSFSFEQELVFCLIHGILHLLGYKHNGDPREAGKMGKKQAYYLSQIFS